ncbi:hypothetical protein [Calditerrivibrio nitroreducens]|uniref:Uncharacterized protein n=1 Tax=Calditerrivibrio nitroreducens (strain DSM 19672 / NBRC 101217 / Yu37-1) TaxID=768670 RepID=E4TIV9_CALNY|nr:hypothetical protein [Calditerrivibrio nitroreducens]ADR18064.1 hypothetical protein Calni_0151 [Calditerrivibrio nitroreducens DSM 19672]
MEKFKNYVLIACGFLLVIFIVLLIKQYNYYKDGQSFEKSGLYIKAVDSYAMVVYMHIPFSIYEGKSIDNILKLADKYSDNVTFSLYCYERLRSSIYGTRWFYTPHKDVLNQIEPEIARIKTRLLIKDGYKKSDNETFRELMGIMTADLSPDPLLSFVSILLFFNFIFITIFAINKSSREKKFSVKTFALYSPLIVFSWILWIITLYKA